MKIVLFGGTGPTGILTLTKALESGHHVVVYARDPSKVHFSHPHLTLVKGDLSDAQAIADLIDGADAVISVLGAKGKTTPDLPLAQAIKNIVAAMKLHQVDRLIVTSTASASDPHDRYQFSFSIATWLVKKLIKTTYDEIVSISQTIRSSKLDWTLVRLPMLTDKPKKNPVSAGYIGDGTIHLFSLNRNDLAAFLVDQLDDDTFIQKAPALSN